MEIYMRCSGTFNRIATWFSATFVPLVATWPFLMVTTSVNRPKAALVAFLVCLPAHVLRVALAAPRLSELGARQVIASISKIPGKVSELACDQIPSVVVLEPGPCYDGVLSYPVVGVGGRAGSIAEFRTAFGHGEDHELGVEV